MATDEEFGGGTFGRGGFGDNLLEEEIEQISLDDNQPTPPEPIQQEPDPEQELFDLAVSGEDIFLTDGGDLAVVRGFDNVIQTAALDVRDVLQFKIGDTLTTDAVLEVRQAITNAIIRDPQLSDPTNVQLQSANPDNNELTFSVTTFDNEDFTLDMVLPNE